MCQDVDHNHLILNNKTPGFAMRMHVRRRVPLLIRSRYLCVCIYLYANIILYIMCAHRHTIILNLATVKAFAKGPRNRCRVHTTTARLATHEEKRGGGGHSATDDSTARKLRPPAASPHALPSPPPAPPPEARRGDSRAARVARDAESESAAAQSRIFPGRAGTRGLPTLGDRSTRTRRPTLSM